MPIYKAILFLKSLITSAMPGCRLAAKSALLSGVPVCCSSPILARTGCQSQGSLSTYVTISPSMLRLVVLVVVGGGGGGGGVCVCVCVCVHAKVCTHVLTWVRKQPQIHFLVFVCEHMCTLSCTHAYAFLCVCVCVCVCACDLAHLIYMCWLVHHVTSTR